MKKQRKIFITGTDTEVGKTFFTCALIRALQNEDYSVQGVKPVAAGCEDFDGVPKNEDALAIIDALKQEVSYSSVNPIALKQPIAPHIAAKNEGQNLSSQVLSELCKLDDLSEEFILVEGAGGWLVPLNDDETLADFAAAEKLEVILVVGLKLGCINHALLSKMAIESAGLKLVGWVANHIDPQMLEQSANIESLKSRLDCPLIAELPYLNSSDKRLEETQGETQSSTNNTADLAAKYVRIRELF